MEELKPGMAVHMVLELSDPNRVMKTVVYDIMGKKIILAQTSPPLLRSHLGESVRVSFIFKLKGIKDVRLAFRGNIVAFMPDYKMSFDQVVPAIVVDRKSELEEIDRRMFYRITPPLNSAMTVMMGNAKMNVVDISLGGAKFVHTMEREFLPGEEIDLTVILDNRRFNVKARIVRAEKKFDTVRAKRTRTISVQFENNSQEFGRALAMKIMMMERQRLVAGKY